MKYTKEMLQVYLSELTIPQRLEVEGIFKSFCKLEEAYYETLEDALESKAGEEQVLKAIDTFGFSDRYKYSAIFKVDNNKVTLGELIKKMPIAQEIDIYSIDENIKFRQLENEFKLDYLINFRTFDGNGKNISVKHFNSILVAYYELDSQIFIEISISDIRLFYRQNDPDYFKNMIQLIKHKLVSMLGVTLNYVDFSGIILDISNKDDLDYVRCTGTSMNTKNKAQATLNSGKSTNLVLPILGDLEMFIKEHHSLFNKNRYTKDIEDKLINFIEDIKVNSEYPWINLTWGNRKGPKNKTLEVKYLFHYQNFILLNYFSHSLGREGMRSATRRLLEEFISCQTSGRIRELESII